MEHPEGMNWHEVAMVGFADGKPVIISSVEPRVFLDTLLSQYRFEDDDGSDEDFDYRFKMLDTDFNEVMENILDGSGIEWRLYPVEVAKDVFCSRPKPDKQLELPIPNETGG